MVVSQHRPVLPSCGTQVTPGGAQVTRRGEGGVVDVERICRPVAVAVDTVTGPGGGNELHRPDGVVEARVAIQPAAIGVGDVVIDRSVESVADDVRC